MADQFITALEEQIAQLERKLAGDLAKLEAAKGLLALWTAGESTPPAGGVAAPAPKVKVGPASRTVQPERQRALEAAVTYLEGRVHPTPTSALYAHIQSLGIVLPGKSPQNNLSAMLSNSGAFKSHGRSGWTLVGVGGSAETPEAADQKGTEPKSAASNLNPPVRPVDPAPGGGT